MNKEMTVPDAVKRDLEAAGVCLQTWMLEQLEANGFNLQRPVHYRYQTHLQSTRIYQYEFAPNDDTSNPDYDADFLDTDAWDRACELLVQDTARYHEEEGIHAPK